MFETLKILMRADSSGLKSDLNKALSMIHKSLADVKTGKIDLSKVFNTNFFGSMNWTSIISKLFAPANLIAFFSAMGALGLTQQLQQQNLRSQEQGSTGLPSNQSGQVTSSAVDIFRTLGTDAGSLSDVQSTLSSFMGITGSLSDSVAITSALGKAVEITGEKLTDVLPSLVNFLQNAGINTKPAIITVIDNLLQAAQQASPATGGRASISTIASDLKDFGIAAQVANLPLSDIAQTIVMFGSEMGNLGIDKATNNMQLLNNALEGTQVGFMASGMSKQAFDLYFTTKGPVEAMAEIDSTVKSLNPSMQGVVADALNISLAALAGATSFLLVKDSIKKVADSANTYLGPALNDINDKWNTTDTLSREIGKRVAELETAFMNADKAISQMTQDLKTSGITTVQFAPGVPNLVDAMKAAVDAQNKNPQLNKNASNSSSSSTQNTIIFNVSGSGATSNATDSALKILNNQSNNFMPGAGANNAPRTTMTASL